MAFARDCRVGTYVAIAMRIIEAEPKLTAQNEPYLQIMGFDTEGGEVGPLRLWQHEDGDTKLGVHISCAVLGLSMTERGTQRRTTMYVQPTCQRPLSAAY